MYELVQAKYAVKEMRLLELLDLKEKSNSVCGSVF